MMFNSQKKREELMQFFYYNDDIERCVKGSKRRWIKSKPDVLDIWPVKLGTNLTKKEILAFENTCFHLPQRAVISPRRLFGGDIPVDVASYPTPPFPDDHPKARSGKNIRRNKKASTTKHANNCAFALTLKAHVRQITMIPHTGYRCIITLDSGIPAEHSTVHDHHWNFPKLFMSVLQRNGDKGLRQARPMDKL
jgi:hypothetical protein